ncbi:winged helix-turn-helix transcriptional regulator [Anaerosphaera multitolerans]|uniref:MarR family transcriptional regulator n=1 Tax=Anaerosphaera multitolerans TaxID=2487351 RepID=A0A437S474_9FIRM|nr:winged helix-turn-helix transcriptional regulator [Anaerosphaera multitolerans]RVU53800.1 MarR family transcriptional regulator [Anaerosphaera multitolerans]
MKYKVALLLKEHLIKFFKETIGFEYKSCELTYFEYKDLYELKEIYIREQFNFDGFVTSYVIPMTVLKGITDFANSKPIVSFGMDAENTYRIILQIILEKRDLSKTRIGIDFLDEKHSLEEFVQGDFLNEHIKSLVRKMESANFDELIEIEKDFLEKHLKAIEEDQVDVVVTFFYSVVEALRDKGVECHYVYPGRHNIDSAFENLERDIQMQDIQHQLPGVIYINPLIERLVNKTTVDIELLFSNIIKIVTELSDSFSIKPIIKRNFLDLEVYIDAIQLQRLTRNYSHCFLLNKLIEEVDFEGIIGYGIGKNLYSSLLSAINGSKYALSYKKENINCSVLIDINEEIYILSGDIDNNVEKLPKYLDEKYINQIAKISKLAPKTINKIIGILQSMDKDNLTTKELAEVLGITKRGANKILTALVDSGLAEIIKVSHDGGKGRPSNVYKLHVEYK